MPIYEYHCPKCETTFERIVASSFTKVKCEKCNVPAERQLPVFAAPPSSVASACKKNNDCPSAGGHSCGGGCGCGGHR